MSNKGDKQQEILLRRHANQAHPARVRQPESITRRVVLEALAGLILGIPLGASCYCFMIILYYPVMLCLMFAKLPHAQSLNFGLVVDVALAALAVAFLLYFTHGAIRQGYRVFAWVQLPLALPIVLVAFYLTMMLHRPILPFTGQ